MSRPRIIQPKAVMRAIRVLTKAHGMPPTIMELRGYLGVGSTRTILRYLQDLETRGMLRRWPGARGMQILGRRER